METWYRRVAEAGHAEAMTRLGKEVICQRGDLVLDAIDMGVRQRHYRLGPARAGC